MPIATWQKETCIACFIREDITFSTENRKKKVSCNKLKKTVRASLLAQGMLSDRYLNGIPEDSRIAKGGFLKKEALTDETLKKIKALNEVATQRGQTLAEMALAWLLKDDMVTSVIIGASSVAQLNDNLQSIKNTKFTAEEIQKINQIYTLK